MLEGDLSGDFVDLLVDSYTHMGNDSVTWRGVTMRNDPKNSSIYKQGSMQRFSVSYNGRAAFSDVLCLLRREFIPFIQTLFFP